MEFPSDPQTLIFVKDIGHGAFGKVALMQHPTNNTLTYAVKSESNDAAIPQLYYEYRVYKRLIGLAGIPRIYGCWQSKEHTHLAMQVLGPSLEKCLRQITKWDVMNWIAPKALTIIEGVHIRGFVHRDIKPDNLLLSLKGLSERQIFLVDYGLCKKYKVNEVEHIAFKNGKRLTGTIRYASSHTHLGEEQSRRDDLESLGYVLIYLLNRKLPWMNITGKDKTEQANKITNLKLNTPLEELCAGLPPGFILFFRHVRALKFDEMPDYAFLRSVFRHV
jgi:serine/threonine protein kinase